MAAPFVSGLAAILRSLPGGETAHAVEQAMESTALDLGDPGKDIHYGYGLIQMDAAILRGLLSGETAHAVKQTMESTALDLGDPGKDIHYGYGLIQMNASIQNVLQSPVICQIYLPLVNR